MTNRAVPRTTQSEKSLAAAPIRPHPALDNPLTHHRHPVSVATGADDCWRRVTTDAPELPSSVMPAAAVGLRTLFSRCPTARTDGRRVPTFARNDAGCAELDTPERHVARCCRRSGAAGGGRRAGGTVARAGGRHSRTLGEESIAHEIARVLDAVDDRPYPPAHRHRPRCRRPHRRCVFRSLADRAGVPATIETVELRGELLDSPGLVEGAA